MVNTFCKEVNTSIKIRNYDKHVLSLLLLTQRKKLADINSKPSNKIDVNVK